LIFRNDGIGVLTMYESETARLILRNFKPEDLDDYHRLIYGDAEVMRYIGNGKTRTREQTEMIMNRFVEYDKQEGCTLWAALDKTSHQLLGQCGLIYIDSTPEIELAYAFGKPYWGQGFATEAARAALRYGFEALKLENIIAVAYPENQPSQRVMQKIGMRHQGITDQYYNTSLVLYTLSREAYLPDESFYTGR
jgi:RimJ/RimL family protein N-acetyltransferase